MPKCKKKFCFGNNLREIFWRRERNERNWKKNVLHLQCSRNLFFHFFIFLFVSLSTSFICSQFMCSTNIQFKKYLWRKYFKINIQVMEKGNYLPNHKMHSTSKNWLKKNHEYFNQYLEYPWYRQQCDKSKKNPSSPLKDSRHEGGQSHQPWK